MRAEGGSTLYIEQDRLDDELEPRQAPDARRADAPGSPRRPTDIIPLIEVFGRIAIALVAVIVTSSVGDSNTLGVLFALTAIWAACIQIGFASNAAELLALGTAVPAIRGALFGFVSASAWGFWHGGTSVDPWRILMCGVTVLSLSILWGLMIGRVARRRRVLIVGSSSAGLEVARELRTMRRPSFELVGFVSDGGDLDAEIAYPVAGPIASLRSLIEAIQPDIIVVAVERDRPAIVGPLLDSAERGFRVIEAAQFCEHAFGRVPVRDIQRVWFMSVLHLYQRQYSRVTKRVFDVVVAVMGLALALPLLPIIWIFVRLSPGPVILSQVRIGAFGQPFTMYKFRTMHSDAEKSGLAVWAQDNDPRVTKSGRLMRRLRLDEIPQLVNVVQGNMSIVGPRPERPELMQYLELKVPFWTQRLLVKPGLTGWAQVRRGYAADAEGSIDKLSYDLWYLRHRSIVVDIAICLKTFGVMLAGTPETGGQRQSADKGPKSTETGPISMPRR